MLCGAPVLPREQMKETLFLQNKICLVTGSARKLGAALTKSLAAAGADVAVHYLSRREQALKTAAAVKAAGRRSLTVRADVTRPKQVERMFHTIENRLGPVDILINNVGDFLLKALSRTTHDDWHTIIGSNLHSAFYCSQRALGAMRRSRWGCIINMGYGPCGRTESRGNTACYHMAKTALLVYTQALAREEARNGIRVNMVSPGTIYTSVNRPPLERIPAGRYARYKDLSDAILFLLSDDASYVTGTNLIVTGG